MQSRSSKKDKKQKATPDGTGSKLTGVELAQKIHDEFGVDLFSSASNRGLLVSEYKRLKNEKGNASKVKTPGVSKPEEAGNSSPSEDI